LPFPTNVTLTAIMSDKNNAHLHFADTLIVHQAWVEQSAGRYIVDLQSSRYLHHYVPNEVCNLIIENMEA
jgi:hypothetical protein